jgi:tetratricopeptide (TPR) repeat protein
MGIESKRRISTGVAMIRSILGAIFAVLSVLLFSSVQAAAAADLKAANTAVEQGQGDEAIRLFTEVLTTNGLSPDDKFSAYTGRGREYAAKAQIADAFARLDEGQRFRDNAIGDLTAALAIKADAANVLVERGQQYGLNSNFDLAIADFSSALKLNNSPATLMLRASSRRAKGDYDDAIADYTAALGMKVPDDSLDAWDIYNERGYAEFLAGRFDAAAGDFDKALQLGSASRADDVLWIPYQLAWLHLSNARAGKNDTNDLAQKTGKINLTQWPGTLISFFLGKLALQDVSGQSSHGAMGRARECNLSFFAGEDALGKNDREQARPHFVRAREVCNIHTLQYLAAGVELERMKH